MNMNRILAPWCYQISAEKGIYLIAPKDIHADIVASFKDDAPALSTVQKWAAEFKRGSESLEDDPRSGRPATATTQENINRVHHMVMDD